MSLVDPPDGLAGSARWFCVRTGEVLVVPRAGAGGALVPEAEDAVTLGLATEEPLFLGMLDGVACWAVDVPADGEPPPGARFEALRALYPLVTERDWVLAGRAVQLVEWRRTHRFCGRCGSDTAPVAGERARRCPACGLLAFPRLSPAIIVLVEREGEILLANGRGFGVPMYSTLAGFVEPGETLEEAVAREVREEVGVRVEGIRYFGSQPWPFPNSLMIGFTARWAGGEIDIDEREIADAAWFRPTDLPMIPPPMSIARRLIDSFVARVSQYGDS